MSTSPAENSVTPRLSGACLFLIIGFICVTPANAQIGKAKAQIGNECAAWPDADRVLRACTTIIQDSRALKVDRATAYNNRGYALQNTNDLQGALEDYNRAIELHTNIEAFYLNRASVHTALGDHERALADYGSSLRLNPRNPISYFLRGSIHDTLGNVDKANADYGKAIEFDRRHKYAYNNRGYAYCQQGENALAIADFTKAIDIDRSDHILYNNRGYCYQNRGDLDRAMQDFNRAIELNPSFPNSLNNRGALHIAKEDFESAARDLDRAVQANPSYPDANVHLCRARVELKQFDVAMQACSNAIRLAPGRFEPHNNRGLAYLGLNQTREAIADFEKALDLEPKAIQPHYNLGRLHLGQRDFGLAIAAFVKAHSLDPGNAPIRRELAGAYIERATERADKKSYQPAIEDLTSAIAVEPSASNYSRRASIHGLIGDSPREIADFSKAIEIEPDAAMYELRARAHERVRNFDSAIADLTAAITIDQRSVSARWRRALAYLNSGNFLGGIADVEAAREMVNDVEGWGNVQEVSGLMLEAAGKPGRASDEFVRSPERPASKLALERINRTPGTPPSWRQCSSADSFQVQVAACKSIIQSRTRGWLSWAHKQLGALYLSEGSNDRAAIEAYGLSIDEEPTFAAYVGRGEARLRLEDPTGAIADLTQAVQLRGLTSWHREQAYALRAKSYEKAAQFDRAIADYSEAMAASGEDRFRRSTYQLAKAMVHLKRRAPHDGLADVDVVLGLGDPYLKIEALEVRGLLREAMGEVEAAKGDFAEVAISRTLSMAALDALRRMGTEPSRLSAQREISRHSEQISARPNDHWLYRERGLQFMRLGELDSAVSDFSRAIEGADLASHIERGRAYLIKRDYASSLSDFNEAVRFAKRRREQVNFATEASQAVAEALMGRGVVFLEIQNYLSAIEDFSEVIAIEPTALALNSRCWARALADRDLQLALADCSEALRQAPGTFNALNSRGLVNLKLGAFARATADYSAALQLDARDANSLFGRGLAKVRGGDGVGDRADMAAAKAIRADIDKVYAGYGIR